MEEQSKRYLFDRKYHERIDETAHSLQVYEDVYQLGTIQSQQEVSNEFFDYCKDRKFFAIILIYNQQKEFLLTRDAGPSFGWALPGGSIKKTETIFQAVKRLAEDEVPGIQLGEIEPVAIVKNTFTHNGESYDHIGLAIIARSRNCDRTEDGSTRKFLKITDSEMENVHRYANKEALRAGVTRAKSFDTKKQDNEIDANEVAQWKYVIHNNIVKRFILTPGLKKKKQQMEIFSRVISGKSKIVDVSCGESKWPQDLIRNNPGIELFFANDLSWSQVQIAATSDPKIKYSNHDAQFLPFRDSAFDLAICMNTLHHMPSRRHLVRLLESMRRVATSVFIWEIDDPKNGSFFPRMLNESYYEGFLKDQGVAYWNFEQFKGLLEEAFPEDRKEFGQFKNVQGIYNYAKIEGV